MYDLIIVGAGPAGIFTALEMIKKGSKQKIIQKRKDSFFETYVRSLVDEARTLAIGKEELMAMIEQAAADKT